MDSTGRAQARALGRLLQGERFDACVSSDLSRARETAEAIAGRPLRSEELSPDWREMAFGAWEGLTWPEIVARFPELRDRPGNVARFPTPLDGESFEQLCGRVKRGLSRLMERVPRGGKALVVTHAGALHALLRVVLGESRAAEFDVRFVPASITRFAIEEYGGRVLTLNRALTEAQPG